MNILVFDIETVPDIEGGQRLYQLDGLNNADTARAMQQIRREETGGSDFLRHHLQRIVAISLVLRYRDKVRVWSLGDENSGEKELIKRFFAGLERYAPMLVSWNGGGFDLPVLHYRSLLHGVSAQRYWEVGETDTSFRYNNYLNRFHYRHLDLMDVLSGYQMRAVARLDQIATLLGFPGKMGMDGSKVWDAYQAGELAAIRDYCETDVLNTYLVYLRFELIRGNLDNKEYHRECQRLREYLGSENKPHFQEFLSNWDYSKQAIAL